MFFQAFTDSIVPECRTPRKLDPYVCAYSILLTEVEDLDTCADLIPVMRMAVRNDRRACIHAVIACCMRKYVQRCDPPCIIDKTSWCCSKRKSSCDGKRWDCKFG